MTFDDLGLEPNILKAVREAGYETPTPIQIAAIPEALRGRDILGIAQTGTGKTASFTLPMIQRLSKGRARARMPRTLVLCPTRELAAQVADNFEKYGKYHKLSMALLIGGVSFGDQDAKLTRGVDVLIATPGRLLDHFERGKLLLNGIEVMVVDEADRMLDMGFIPDIERIFKLTPMTRQTLFFSATMPPEIQRITDAFLHDPARIEVARPATAAATITQKIINVPTSDDRLKRMTLRHLLDLETVRNGIIFCNRKSTVDVVAKSLQTHGYDARPIHGDLPQAYRTETIEKFRSGDVKFIVASDVAARGLDIPDVSHIFNYDAPFHPDDYVHRIGRTGRAGRLGTAYTLVTPADAKSYRAILDTIRVENIDALDLGDFFATAVDAVKARGDERPRRGRDDRGRGRDGRGRAGQGRGRGLGCERRGDRRPPRSEEAIPLTADAPQLEAAAVERSAEAQPRPSHGRRNEPREGAAREHRPRESRLREPGDRSRNEPRETVKGFGAEVPAFMAR
jgi:superfamily II DNA/RNA helicase